MRGRHSTEIASRVKELRFSESQGVDDTARHPWPASPKLGFRAEPSAHSGCIGSRGS